MKSKIVIKQRAIEHNSSCSKRGGTGFAKHLWIDWMVCRLVNNIAQSWKKAEVDIKSVLLNGQYF